MNAELPSETVFMVEQGKYYPDSMNYTRSEVIALLMKYGELCAKHGAKSIRYQAIEIINQKAQVANNQSLDFIADELNQVIQNLQP